MSEHTHTHDEDCGCGHDHSHEDEEAIFLVTDAEGVEHEMVMVYSFETDQQAYAVLLNRHEVEADGVIFRIEENEGEAYLVNIEDDKEWERVVGVYNEIAAKEMEADH